MTRTVLFVCEHGAFRSRIAAAYFNAAAPKGWRALSAGRDPQAEVSARLEPLLTGTPAAEHLESDPPRGVAAVLSDRVIAIDCMLDGADLWVTEAQRIRRSATRSPSGLESFCASSEPGTSGPPGPRRCRVCRSAALDSARQPEPSTLVLNDPSCYHFRAFDPRVFAILSVSVAAVTIGWCSHI